MYRRRKKLIRLDVQLRVVLIALGVASLVLLINFQLGILAFSKLSSEVTRGMDARVAFEGLQHALFNRFLVSIGFSIPIAVAIGILYSFKFAGPIYRFGKYFKELQSGRWDARCSLRKGDDLQDLCATMNETLDQVRGFLAQNREAIAQVDAFLKEGILANSGKGCEEVKKLQERIAAINTVYGSRLPGPSTASQAPAGRSSQDAESLAAIEAFCATRADS